MAELTIMLRRDPTTGKQNVIIKLDSEADALPYEHEQMHRELVEKLLGKSLEDFGEIIVEREATPETAAPSQDKAPEQERQKEKTGN
jgi:hypothetical protein